MSSATQRKNIQLSLGAFTVPVNVETALESTSQVSLNTLCCQDHAPAATRQTLACPVCDNADKTTFSKGKTMGGGRFVVVPENVLDDIGIGDGFKNSLDINVHPASQMSRLLPGEKCYVLVPGSPAAAESYALIAALVDSRPDLAFVARWAVRTALAMYQLGTFEGRLVLKQLAWPSSVRVLPEVPAVYREALMTAASALVDAIVVDFDASTYVDDRSAKLLDFIASAEGVTGATVIDDDGTVTTAPSMDLEASLKAAVAAAAAVKAPAVPAQVKPIRKRAPRKASVTQTSAASA